MKRTVEDTLPTAALVAMCSCAIGSTTGFDECYQEALNVVNENRPYVFGGGISKAKALLNKIHKELGASGAEESYTHLEGQYITVHRANPVSGKGYFLIARTKFHPDAPQDLSDVVLEGQKAECIYASSLVRKGDREKGDKEIKPIPVELVDLEMPQVDFDEATGKSIIRSPKNFPQGSIAIFETTSMKATKDLMNFVSDIPMEIVQDLDLLDLNVALYRCDAEERDFTGGHHGVYNVPDYGQLTYAGLQGWVSPLREVVHNNNLGHPICANLRNGYWAIDYILNRLQAYSKAYPHLSGLLEWFESRFARVKEVPSFLVPRYFTLTVFTAHSACLERAFQLFPKYISHGTILLRELALTSIQMMAKMPTAGIYPDRADIGSMAAGLPHFSVNYMRCWGRDVFLSLPGLLLATGRYDDAKQHILAFAKTLKHGLIPNLLDSGRNPRYNARDATWFFLQAIQEYILSAPNGDEILKEKVSRRFLRDDTWFPVEDERAFTEYSSIEEIIYEILCRHARGIEFREANAGPGIDSQMRDEGFNQRIWVDWKTGIIFGGNQWNCGTWMDKMGESERAGNKGYPGTPRDGAAIEITGLLKSALRFVIDLHDRKLFRWDSVETADGEKVSFKEWDSLLQKSFEHCYYVPEDPADDHNYDLDSKIVHRRGIYKDLYRSGKPYEDYQLRPNFCIAMVVAPELFDQQHAVDALRIADQLIRGPVGMRTLDPGDANYRPYYRNSEDSTDFQTSKGRNYHQGPEWLWCTGFFLRAMLRFELQGGLSDQECFQEIRQRLRGHAQWMNDSHWAGLTDSSPTQAWSSATLLDLYHDIYAL
jgi:glycogen debranching enzyme